MVIKQITTEYKLNNMSLDFLPLHVTAGLSFASDFYYHHCGTKFNQETMENPIARIEMDKIQQEFLRRKYPQYFKSLAPIKPHINIGIGVATIPKIFGCKIRYMDHMNPVALPLFELKDDLMQLREPNYEDQMRWLLEEIDILAAHGYQKSEIGLPDLQGELNIATKLVGDDRMLGLMANKNKEPLVRHILEITTNAYIKCVQTLRKATNKPAVSTFSIAGCTYFYLSPSLWTKYILPQIKKLEILGKNINLHHCGEASAAKIDAFAQYPWSQVELGFGSDLKHAREKFIHPQLGPVHFSCRISPYRMLNQPTSQITQDVEWILQNVKGGSASINVVGCPNGTPDVNLEAYFGAINAYNSQKEAEMDEDDRINLQKQKESHTSFE